jgi:hypothetical protein
MSLNLQLTSKAGNISERVHEIANGCDRVKELEQQLGAGLIEEVIEVAEGELQLIETMEKAQV